MDGFDPHARNRMSTWLGARLSETASRWRPAGVLAGSGRPLPRTRLGVPARHAAGRAHRSRVGVLPDLSGRPPPAAGPPDGPVMAH